MTRIHANGRCSRARCSRARCSRAWCSRASVKRESLNLRRNSALRRSAATPAATPTPSRIWTRKSRRRRRGFQPLSHSVLLDCWNRHMDKPIHFASRGSSHPPKRPAPPRQVLPPDRLVALPSPTVTSFFRQVSPPLRKVMRLAPEVTRHFPLVTPLLFGSDAPLGAGDATLAGGATALSAGDALRATGDASLAAEESSPAAGDASLLESDAPQEAENTRVTARIAPIRWLGVAALLRSAIQPCVQVLPRFAEARLRQDRRLHPIGASQKRAYIPGFHENHHLQRRVPIRRPEQPLGQSQLSTRTR